MAADEGNNRTDWAEVTTGINQSIQDAIARYHTYFNGAGNISRTVEEIGFTAGEHFG